MKTRLAALLLGTALALNAYAADKQLRIGTLASKNSLYHRQLMELGEAWRTAQGGQGKYLVYPDGSQGGETDMVRRMRIGQLQGGLLSVVGLREIEPSIAALQNMPMMFKSWEEVDYVREKMRPAMEKKFLEKGFVVLAWGDAGWVRFFSKSPAFAPNDFKGMKFFAWGAEADQQEIMKNLGYTPVPLETADILPAIQTGMINAVPSTPYFALATQIYTTANNMLDLNWSPIVGALIITKRAWDELTPEGQVIVREAGAKAGVQLRAKARQEVDEAVEAMKKRGLTVNKPNAEQMKEWNALADGLYPRIRGKLVPAEQFDEVVGLLKAFRAGKK
ncbi:MAG: TRAP transporter substrate-binding protein DctP [Gammaproteobacteria bacterium]|nr:TRAP transporter substrate-binding protein DctP [Gammaproteobacteria bacterium]MBU1600943.1 TRAP transporter substrate-binding protein DctP [Gammaproteobacteria bacterium]MBU2434302.1 TRAP transporter substrate-binding protein DctP [Gammaproteobacteria bacterium]MBU2450706.1 TRAP transporter substrate-binding protein DctP [Gammaproteobacteria bacterium]